MFEVYRRVVLQRPMIVVGLLLVMASVALTRFSDLRLDASSDALLLQGDPDLAFFRETSERYAAAEFLVLTWQPKANAPLLSDQSLESLSAMVEALRALPGVADVTSVLDVPLLQSPPLSLTDLSQAEQLPTLRDPGVSRTLALDEFTTSPIYRNLLVGEAGDVMAVQVSLEEDAPLQAALNEREALRELRAASGLTTQQSQQLAVVEARYDELQRQAGTRRDQLVAEVRAIADVYRADADIFVGGVPMIAADMIAFVRSDLVVFGSAIVIIMMLVLALIFRDWRWVLAPILNCVVTATLMLGLLAWLDWRMTVISSNFVAVLLIVTLSLSVHLVVRYRELEHTQPDMPRRQRAGEAARLMAVPCFYTALTTIVAFASLLVAGIQPVIDFGLMMTVGIIVGFLCTFTLVPALMSLLPEPARALRLAADGSFTGRLAAVVEQRGGWVLGVTGLLTVATVVGITQLKVENRFIDYFKPSTEIYQGMELLDARLGGTIPLDIVLYPPGAAESANSQATSTVGTAVDSLADDGVGSDPLSDDAFGQDAVLDTGFGEDPLADDSFGGDALSDDGFGTDALADGAFGDDPFASDPFGSDPFGDSSGSKPSYWFTPQGRAVLDRVHQRVQAHAETGKVLSLSTAFSVMDELYGAKLGPVELALVQNSMPEVVNATLVAPYFDAEVDQARLSVRVMETSKTLRRDQFLRDLRIELIDEEGLAPEQVRFTSLLVLYNNVLQSLFTSQILTLGAVFLAIGLMFWVLFRSLALALLCLAPNLLAASMVLGIMGLAGIPLDIMTITIAAIVVGIGVDDCIHYIHRFKAEFSIDGDYHAAMHRSHGSIGRAMYYTTLTIMVGFSLLTLSNFTPSLYFGVLTDVAMAAAVAGALLLLPKLIVVFKPFGADKGVSPASAPGGSAGAS